MFEATALNRRNDRVEWLWKVLFLLMTVILVIPVLLILTVLVVNDNAYGMIKWKQQDMGLDDFGLDFSNPDFVQYAASYGARGHRIEAAADLLPVLAQCLETRGVDLIDVQVDLGKPR